MRRLVVVLLLAVGLLGVAGLNRAEKADAETIGEEQPARTVGMFTWSGWDGIYAAPANDPATQQRLVRFGYCDGAGDPYDGWVPGEGAPFYAPVGGGDWSPDGTRIAFVARSCATPTAPLGLWLASADGKNFEQIASKVLVPARPKWSADGNTVMVEASQDGVHLFNVDTHAKTVIPGAAGGAFAGRADVLAYHCGILPRSDHSALCVANSDGTGVRTVTPDFSDEFPSGRLTVSPDGALVAHNCGNDVCVIDVSDGASRTVATAPGTGDDQRGTYTDLSWSPDGRFVAVDHSDNSAGTHRIELLDPTGSAPAKQLFAPSNDAHHLTWAPDSSALAWNSSTYPNDRVTIVSLTDGTALTGIAQGAPVDASGEYHMLSWQGCFTATCSGPREITAPCTINGTNAADTLTGTSGADVICARGGNDRIAPGGGNDVIRGGAGTDAVDYRAAPRGVTVDLIKQSASGWGSDVFISVENAQGSAHDDVLLGSPGRNILTGNNGDDDLVGRSGDDTLSGNDGNDYLRGEADDDDISGGSGSDRVSFASAPRRVRVNLGSSMATGEGTDMLIGIERVSGSQFDDFIVGSSAGDVVYAGDGIDTVEAGGGNDRVYGGDDKDYLYGQAGRDSLDGQAGRDYINGGAGEDSCTSGVVNSSC